MGYIAAFANTGDPNGSGLPFWPPRYDAARSEVLMFPRDAVATFQADAWKSRLDLIERGSAVGAQAVRSR